MVAAASRWGDVVQKRTGRLVRVEVKVNVAMHRAMMLMLTC